AVGVDGVAGAVGPVDRVRGSGRGTKRRRDGVLGSGSWVLNGGVFGNLCLVPDAALEGLVDAVLGPGLGEGFEFDVGGFAADAAVLGLNRLHLVEAQEEVGVASQAGELLIGQVADRDVG